MKGCCKLSLRSKVARALRKWADLLDPRTPPSAPDVLVIKLEMDTAQFEGSLRDLRRKLVGIADAMGASCN